MSNYAFNTQPTLTTERIIYEASNGTGHIAGSQLYISGNNIKYVYDYGRKEWKMDDVWLGKGASPTLEISDDIQILDSYFTNIAVNITSTQEELRKLESWFRDFYDVEKNKIDRATALGELPKLPITDNILGITYNTTIELHQQANVISSRISEIRRVLGIN